MAEQSSREYAEEHGVPIIQAIREMRWAEHERLIAQRDAARESGVTRHVLDSTFRLLINTESDAEPEAIVATLDTYVEYVLDAPKWMLVRHVAGLLWRVVRSPAGDPRWRR